MTGVQTCALPISPEHSPANSTGKLQGQAERQLEMAGAQACAEGTGHTGSPSVRRGEGPQPRPCLHAPTTLEPDLPRAPDPCPPVNPFQSFPRRDRHLPHAFPSHSALSLLCLPGFCRLPNLSPPGSPKISPPNPVHTPGFTSWSTLDTRLSLFLESQRSPGSARAPTLTIIFL